MFSLPDGLVPLPAAANFIGIDHRLQLEVAVVTDEAVGIEDPDSPDGDAVIDNTVLADGPVLTANEVEEVLKDAFAGTDHLVPTQDAQEGTTPVGICLISGSSAPSLGCIDTAYPPIYRGASHPRVSEARPQRHDR
jgi:hypothetical protein